LRTDRALELAERGCEGIRTDAGRRSHAVGLSIERAAGASTHE
jgi:hypothetical protein